MEFNEKLQELRKQKGITQEKLARSLYVSRTAISKWESGRGYPSIDSLKEIAKFFDITVDELLSSDQLLTIAKQKQSRFCELVFGLLDLSVAILFFFPFFAQKSNGEAQSVSLFLLGEIAPYLKTVYLVIVLSIIVSGILTLTLQTYTKNYWIQAKHKISLILNIVGVVLFIISPQPYAATFLLIILIIKTLTLIKK